MEDKLREGQCRDALEKVRTKPFVKRRLLKYKARNVRHQGPNTRARALLDSNDGKFKLAAAKYRRARDARIKLDVQRDIEWEKEFLPLVDSDIRCIKEDEEVDGDGRRKKRREGDPAEGRRMVSWIWRSADADAAGVKGMNEAIHVEWAKARARVERFKEERDLAEEEMERTLVFLEVKAKWWEARNELKLCTGGEEGEEAQGNNSAWPELGNNPSFDEGRRAYAHEQASVFRALRSKFEAAWTTKKGDRSGQGSADREVTEDMVERGDEYDEDDAVEEGGAEEDFDIEAASRALDGDELDLN